MQMTVHLLWAERQHTSLVLNNLALKVGREHLSWLCSVLVQTFAHKTYTPACVHLFPFHRSGNMAWSVLFSRKKEATFYRHKHMQITIFLQKTEIGKRVIRDARGTNTHTSNTTVIAQSARSRLGPRAWKPSASLRPFHQHLLSHVKSPNEHVERNPKSNIKQYPVHVSIDAVQCFSADWTTLVRRTRLLRHSGKRTSLRPVLTAVLSQTETARIHPTHQLIKQRNVLPLKCAGLRQKHFILSLENIISHSANSVCGDCACLWVGPWHGSFGVTIVGFACVSEIFA